MLRVDAASSRRSAARMLAAALLCVAISPRIVLAQDGPLKFAIIGDALTKSADVAPVRQLLDALGHERELSFIVYDGNIKGASEPCRDRIYDARHELLDASRVPLVVVPGQHDWADCGQPQAGGYDPVERLDFVRQLFFGDSNALGTPSMALARESEVARFRPYRENVRWRAEGVAFVALNAPSPNNHYLTAGGRNGEFEDRTIANAFWLEHAAETARRAGDRALVVILEGDPDFARYERRDRFAWLRFTRGSQPRDGFVEFKRSLVKVADLFRGPVIVLHGSSTPVAGGFLIDQPLHDEKGALVANLTRIAIALKKPQTQWLEIQTESEWRPPFRVRVREVTRSSAPASDDGAHNSYEPPSSESARPDTRDELPAPAIPPSSPPSLPPILTPPPGMPPILPTPASGVQPGA